MFGQVWKRDHFLLHNGTFTFILVLQSLRVQWALLGVKQEERKNLLLKAEISNVRLTAKRFKDKSLDLIFALWNKFQDL